MIAAPQGYTSTQELRKDSLVSVGMLQQESYALADMAKWDFRFGESRFRHIRRLPAPSRYALLPARSDARAI
jgi:hypothetical protein